MDFLRVKGKNIPIKSYELIETVNNVTKESLDLIDKHSRFWMQIMSGSQGFSGKRAVNAGTMFDQLFSENG